MRAVGAGAARPGRDRLAEPPAGPGRPARPGPPGCAPCADGAGGAERGHRRGRRGQPPPVAPGGLAAARPRAVGAVVGCARRLRRLRGTGPARVAAGRPLPGGLQPRRPHGRPGLRGLRAAADAQRLVAVAVAPLALVGQGPGRRASGVPGDRGAVARAAGPDLRVGRQPARAPRRPAGRVCRCSRSTSWQVPSCC